MSLLLNLTETVRLNDDATEDLFLSGNENDNFNFKYVPTNHFKYIIKDVRRQRCREEEESVWASFVKQQELNSYVKNGIHTSVQSIKQLLDEGMREADKELKKLETDILPDRMSKECSKTANNQKRKPKVNNTRDTAPKKVSTKDTGTGSTNLLLTIPEEDNAPAYQRRHEPEDFKSYTRKSRSGHTIPRKRQSSRQMHHATNGIEYNSSPESSVRRDGVADGVIYVRPDPFTIHKVLTIQRKVCELLDEIAIRLGNISAPDGIKDLQRRQQCVTEFVVRFSRNYLYDLNRYVKDIQRHMCVISPRATIKPNHRNLGLHMHAIEHKLLAAHQLLLHALVAYCKHVPSSIPKGHPGKFKEILQVVLDLKTMCDRLHLNYFDSGDTDVLSLGKEIESKCNAVLSKLKIPTDNDFLDTNKTSSMASFIPNSANKRRLNRKQLSNRLSMYNMDIKVSKNNLKSKTNYQKDKRYSAIDVKRVSNELILNQPYPSPATPKDMDQNTGIKKHRSRTFVKEEDLKTMMDVLPLDSDNGSNFETQRHNNAMLTRRICKAPRKYSGKLQNQKQLESIENIVKNTSTNNDDESTKRETITEEHLSNLVPVIADFMSYVSNKQNESETRSACSMKKTTMKTLMKFLQKYQLPENMNAKTNKSTNCDICYSGGSECECFQTNRTLTENFRKNGENMQLICVSSIENTSNVPRCCDASCQADYESLTKLPNFEAKIKEAKLMADSQNNIELVVSEEAEMNFLKYRREYQRMMQSIPMYSSNTQNKPWDIVAWISDKLVDELITEIAKELQIDDVIQKLFELEFQEF